MRFAKFIFLIFLLSITTIPTYGSKVQTNNLPFKITVNSVYKGIGFDNVTHFFNDSTLNSAYPSVAIDKMNNIYVVWSDFTNYNGSGTDQDIFFKFLNATTQKWSPITVVSTESIFNSNLPQIAVDSHGNLHVVWEDLTNFDNAGFDWDIFYKSFNATTNEWSNTTVISTESSSDSTYPAIAVDSFANVFVVWQDATNYNGAGTDQDIFYKFFNATTQTWSTTIVVSNISTALSQYPSIAIDSHNNVHIMWNDYTYYNGEGYDSDIFYRFFNATSQIWSSTSVISTESTGSSYTPYIAIDSNDNMHVVWSDITNYNGAGTDQDIFYKFFNATTQNWSTTTVVSTESTSNSYYPRIAIDSNDNIHVVWEDLTNYNGAGTDYDVFYKMFNVTSQLWSNTSVVSTESYSNSYYPTLVINSHGIINVFWEDNTNLNGAGSDYDIFYKFGLPEPKPTVIQLISSNPSKTGLIEIGWQVAWGATQYKIYRNKYPIYSAIYLTPIATVYHNTSFSDQIYKNGLYYYVVTSANNLYESVISNMIFVNVTRPPINYQESNLNTGISSSKGGFLGYNYLTFSFLSVMVLEIIIIQKRRKNI